MSPLKWSTSTIVIVAAAAAAAVAALIYVRAKQVGPGRSLVTGALRPGVGVMAGVTDITHARGRL